MSTITNNTNGSVVASYGPFSPGQIPPLSSFNFDPASSQNRTLTSGDSFRLFSSEQGADNRLFLFWNGTPAKDQHPDGALLTTGDGTFLDNEGNFTFSIPSPGTCVITDPRGGGTTGGNRTRDIIIIIIIIITIIIIIIIIIVVAKGGKKSDSDDLSALDALRLEE